MTKLETKKVINTFVVECITLKMDLESKQATRECTQASWDTLNSLLVSLNSSVYQGVIDSDQYRHLEEAL